LPWGRRVCWLRKADQQRRVAEKQFANHESSRKERVQYETVP
jgi:hypothetical protein